MHPMLPRKERFISGEMQKGKCEIVEGEKSNEKYQTFFRANICYEKYR